MKASELRIGNLVNHIRKGVIVVGIMELDFVEKGVLDIEPIPLTEEWLVRFGFEFEKYTESIIANKSDLALLTMVGWKYFTFTTNLGNGKNEYCKDIIYVHQLQNLFYSITGEELTISDPVFINSL